MFGCDNRCSDKALRLWQCASVVVDDVKESDTVNLCQQCYNERLTAQGLAPLKSWQWKAVVEKKALCGRLWRMLGKDQPTQGRWEYFSLARGKAKKIERMLRKKSRKKTRPMATIVSCQRISGMSGKCCGHRLHSQNDDVNIDALKDGDREEYTIVFKVEVSATEWGLRKSARGL